MYGKRGESMGRLKKLVKVVGMISAVWVGGLIGVVIGGILLGLLVLMVGVYWIGRELSR